MSGWKYQNAAPTKSGQPTRRPIWVIILKTGNVSLIMHHVSPDKFSEPPAASRILAGTED